MSNGFIKLPRSLAFNDFWVDARPTHQTVFNMILLRVCFKKTKHNIQGNSIDLEPAQLCASVRQLQQWCGKWITKNDVEGALKYFVKVKFLRQEVRQGKTLLTVCESDIYAEILKASQTTTQTEVRQKSDIKEEGEEREEIASAKKVSISFDRKTNEFVGITPQVLAELKILHPHISKIEEHLKRAKRWLMATDKGKTRIGSKAFINRWLSQADDSEITQTSSKLVPLLFPTDLPDVSLEVEDPRITALRIEQAEKRRLAYEAEAARELEYASM